MSSKFELLFTSYGILLRNKALCLSFAESGEFMDKSLTKCLCISAIPFRGVRIFKLTKCLKSCPRKIMQMSENISQKKLKLNIGDIITFKKE